MGAAAEGDDVIDQVHPDLTVSRRGLPGAGGSLVHGGQARFREGLASGAQSAAARSFSISTARPMGVPSRARGSTIGIGGPSSSNAVR